MTTKLFCRLVPVGAALAMLVSHCRAQAPAYAPQDFPDAGLDADGLARLLDRIGGWVREAMPVDFSKRRPFFLGED